MASKKTEQYFRTVLTQMLDERYESNSEQRRTRESSERRPDLIDWAVSVDSTVNRAHQHATNLPRDTGGTIELQESVRRAG